MFIVYIVVVAFVTALLLSIPLFPFWKVWQRIKSHHPDIWRSAGPFEVMSMIASPGLAGIFIDVLIRMENDKDLLSREFGWKPAQLLDLGALSSARGLECLVLTWVSIMGSLGHANFNWHIAVGPKPQA